MNVPGSVVAGRYRLLVRQPSVGWAQWWLAVDLKTASQVALTIVHFDVIRSRDLSPNAVRRFCDTTLAASDRRVRILDVLIKAPHVVIVGDVPPIRTIYDASPVPPDVAGHMIRHLASTVRTAHKAGTVVSLDHPSRVRVTEDGEAVLAFSAARFGATEDQDIVGLGAVLHTLLVGEWPEEPRSAPAEGRIGSVAEAAREGLFASVDDFLGALDDAETAVRPQQTPLATPRARMVWVLAAVAVLVVFGTGGWLLTTSMFGGNYGSVKNVAAPLLPTATTVPSTTPAAPILPSGARVWSAVRAPDNSGDARFAVDADPTTSWTTDSYRARFGSTGNGIGVLVAFAEAVDISRVWVTTRDPGTLVEVRTPPDAGGTLDSTRVLGTSTLDVGVTDIPVDAPAELREILIWVAELAPSGQQFAADFSEIGFTRK